MAPSYQLPDLLNLSRRFELRTNPSCHMVTLASEAWLVALKKTDIDYVLTESEQSSLHSMKTGLLAALCFPSCDGAPLRLLTDFLNFHILAHERMRLVSDKNRLGWLLANRKNGLDRLSDHELFRYLVPQIVRLSSRAPLAWHVQFTNSVDSYGDAQLQLMNNRRDSVIPDVGEYLKIRRGLCGFGMLLDLLELTENMTFPSTDAYRTSEKMTHLKQVAVDIISCSLDVVSYNRDQARGNRHNFVAILMTQNDISVQGALNLAGVYIKDLVDSFVASERILLNARGLAPPQPNHSRPTLYLQPWNWFPFPHVSVASSPLMSETPKHDRDDAFLSDITSYVQALRDCIVGTINWAYETELYFGKKGEEIRTFGWIFLDENLRTDGEELEIP